jgi:cryptochrome
MASGIEVLTPVSHTLFDPAEILQKVLTNQPTAQFLTTCPSTSVSSLLNFRFGVLENGSRPPLAYQSFVSIAGEPPEPVMEEYSELPPVGDTGEYELLPVPTVEDLGYGDISQVRVTPHFLKELVSQLLLDRFLLLQNCYLQEEISPFRGGETEALKRMKESLQNKVGAFAVLHCLRLFPSINFLSCLLSQQLHMICVGLAQLFFTSSFVSAGMGCQI